MKTYAKDASMARSLNKVTLIGNLGADPEIRTFSNGGRVCSLRIATSDSWKDRNTGEQRERTEWHQVEIYSEPLSNIAEQYLRKGSKIYIEGKLETRKWQDESGKDRYTTSVSLRPYSSSLIMLDGRGNDGSSGYRDNQSNSSQSDPPQDYGQSQDNQSGMSDYDDDIPF